VPFSREGLLTYGSHSTIPAWNEESIFSPSEVTGWLNAVSYNGLDTPLHIAAGRGFKTIVQILLSAGAKVDVENRSRSTALSEAVRCYDYEPEIIELLVRAGANVNVSAPHLGESLLVWAVQKDAEDVVRLVLGAGANLENPTPLCLAARLRNVKIIRHLLGGGADVYARMGPEPWRTTALHCAVEAGMILSRDAVQLLMEKGANVHAERFDGLTPMQLAIRDHGEECGKALFGESIM
jgi:ankyrin repeat protein